MRNLGRRTVGRAALASALAGLGLAVVLGGCAYYNTFYHARKFYNEAEEKRREAEEQGREPTEAQTLYEKSIKKCAKVIVEYPGSKWVDDALLLMGNGFFYREEYSRALRKYEELITLYPKSPFLNEAHWMSAMAEYRLGNADKARALFREIGEGSPDPDRREEARVMIARSWEAEAKYRRCVEEVLCLTEGEDGQKARGRVFQVLGDCYRALGEYALARPMYEQAAARSERKADRFEAELRVGELLTDVGRIDEARAHYERLMSKETNPVRSGKLKMATARVMMAAGQVEDAIGILEDVAQDPAVRELAGEAQFEIGVARERYLEDRDAAIQAFSQVGKRKSSRETAARATKRGADLTRLNEYLEQKGTAPPDSLPLIDFAIAEHYLFEMGEPRLAAEQYERVAEGGPDETLAAKALLAVAWILGSVDGDSTGADSLYARVVDRFPETEHADLAREKLGLPPRPKPEPPVPAPESAGGAGVGGELVGPPRPEEAMIGPSIPEPASAGPGAPKESLVEEHQSGTDTGAPPPGEIGEAPGSGEDGELFEPDDVRVDSGPDSAQAGPTPAPDPEEVAPEGEHAPAAPDSV